MEIPVEQRELFQFTFKSPTDDHIRRLTPVEFEQFIGYLFERDNLYNPLQVGGPGDGGVDIELYSRDTMPPRLIGVAQCKRLLSDTVSAAGLAPFIIAANDAKAERRYFFITSKFGPSAYSKAREHNISLFDCAGIRFWIHDIQRREALRSTAPTLPDMENMPIPIICISNNKGGVGKTTITGNLAVALVAEHGNVLVIDADPQGDLTLWLTKQSRYPAALSLNAVLMQEVPIHPLMQRTVEKGVWILPSSRDLNDFPNGLHSWTLERRLAQALANLPLADPPIRCILIDTPPALNALSRAALLAATSLLLPLQLDMFSLEGLDEMLRFVEQTEASHQKNPLRILGGVASMVDVRFKWGFKYQERFQLEDRPRLRANGLSGERFWCGMLRERGDFRKAQGDHQSVLQFATYSDAAKDVLDLAREVTKRVPILANAGA